MDNGEVYQNLDEDWTFMGADLVEWGTGLVSFMIVSLFAPSAARGLPFMLVAWVGTAQACAFLRRSFPDGRRGVKNAALTAFGLPPPGLPEPASIRDIWSAAPVRSLSSMCKFRQLGLDRLFDKNQTNNEKGDE